MTFAVEAEIYDRHTAREELWAALHHLLGSPEGLFELEARAWYAVGTK